MNENPNLPKICTCQRAPVPEPGCPFHGKLALLTGAEKQQIKAGFDPVSEASETPLTDAQEVRLKSRGNWHGDILVVGSDFARKLERQLAKVRQRPERTCIRPGEYGPGHMTAEDKSGLFLIWALRVLLAFLFFVAGICFAAWNAKPIL